MYSLCNHNWLKDQIKLEFFFEHKQHMKSLDGHFAALCGRYAFLLSKTAICTDNQSLPKAIRSGFADTADLRSMLNKQADKTTLLWIPGHHGVAEPSPPLSVLTTNPGSVLALARKTLL